MYALNDEINDAVKNLEFNLEHGTFKKRYFKKSNSCEDRTKLRLSAKEEINEVGRLKEEVGNNEDKLLNAETKISKLLTDLTYEKEDIFFDLTVLELKLVGLGIPPIQVDKIKNPVFSS